MFLLFVVTGQVCTPRRSAALNIKALEPVERIVGDIKPPSQTLAPHADPSLEPQAQLAASEDEAGALIRRGQIELGACHEHGAVGPATGIISASTA